MAASISIFVFVPLLTISGQACRMYLRAQNVTAAAMYGRLCMEEARMKTGLSEIRSFQRNGRNYTGRIEWDDLEDGTRCCKVTVEDPDGKTFVLRRRQ